MSMKISALTWGLRVIIRPMSASLTPTVSTKYLTLGFSDLCKLHSSKVGATVITRPNAFSGRPKLLRYWIRGLTARSTVYSMICGCRTINFLKCSRFTPKLTRNSTLSCTAVTFAWRHALCRSAILWKSPSHIPRVVKYSINGCHFLSNPSSLAKRWNTASSKLMPFICCGLKKTNHKDEESWR